MKLSPATVIPAKAGIHLKARSLIVMDSRLRGNDGRKFYEVLK